uniref:Uncharacterized protein n=1 Tax=Romanomermis culicivorax TaxID=13658 RepID=A0A915HG16_ROMCU
SRDTNLARKILKTQNFYLTDFDFLIRYDKSNDADQQFLSILCSNCTHEIDYLSNTKFDNGNVAIVKSRYEKEEL